MPRHNDGPEPPPPDDLLDPFLAESGGADVLEQLAGEPSPLPATGRARLLAALDDGSRFERFVTQAAALLDLPAPEARALLDRLDRPEVWEPGFVSGMTLYHVRGGDKVAAAITGFVRLRAGHRFPEHAHLGDEQVLVMQGSFVDSDGSRVVRPGEVVQMSAGSSHTFEVREGPDLLYLAVVQTGIRIGDQELRADHPGM